MNRYVFRRFAQNSHWWCSTAVTRKAWSPMVEWLVQRTTSGDDEAEWRHHSFPLHIQKPLETTFKQQLKSQF